MKPKQGTDLEAMLRTAAAESGLSMLAISKRTGLPYACVHGFASGTQTLRLTSAERLLDGLGLTVEIRPAKAKG